MPKGLPQQVLDLLATRAIKLAQLFTAELESITLRLSTTVSDIEYDGNIYTGGGALTAISGIEESLAFEAPGTSIVLDGVRRDAVELILEQEFRGKEVSIMVAFLDADDQILHVEESFIGILESYTISASNSSNTVAIKIPITNEFARFEDVNGRRTNSAEHKRLFPSDTIMDSVAGLSTKNVRF